MKPSTIAIDGPAASGKSTIGYHLAKCLSYLYLDTGILYRAVTWAALKRQVPIEDEVKITELTRTLEIQVSPATVDDGRQYTVYVDAQDVTWAIRNPEVDSVVSPVSAYPGVRNALTERMRTIAKQGNVVMVGRDIGTVVLPDADLKLYIVASAEERANRRLLDNETLGKHTNYEEVLAIIKKRDRIDSNRTAAPLRAAEDALIIDTTELTIELMFDVVDQIIKTHATPATKSAAPSQITGNPRAIEA